MTNDYIIKILKYGIIIFILLVILIIIASFNYSVKGLPSKTLGEGWYMVFQYEKKDDSFVIDFGYLSVVIPFVSAILMDVGISLYNRRKYKIRNGNFEG